MYNFFVFVRIYFDLRRRIRAIYGDFDELFVVVNIVYGGVIKMWYVEFMV